LFYTKNYVNTIWKHNLIDRKTLTGSGRPNLCLRASDLKTNFSECPKYSESNDLLTSLF